MMKNKKLPQNLDNEKLLCYNHRKGEKIMPSSSNKKLSILYTLKILKDYSDENHLLSQTEIANKIKSHFGMDVERKSIGANLESLIDFGYDIIKSQNGCYLGEREFEPSEIQFLVDAVFSSKAIDSKHAQDLAKKIYSFLSENERKTFKYIFKSNEIGRTKNKEIFYNIDILSEAIQNKKQVEFSYNRFSLNKKEEKEKYIINPYALINNQGKYYLVCSREKFARLSNYRLERIENIKILDSKATPITKLKGFENGFDAAKYANENIYMFGGKAVEATLKLGSDYATSIIDDWFTGARFYEKDGQVFADIKANEQALVYWCLQYGDSIELLEPLTTRDKIKKAIEKLKEKYK